MKKVILVALLIATLVCIQTSCSQRNDKPEIMCEFTLSGDTLYHTHLNLSTKVRTIGPDTCEFYQEALRIFADSSSH